MNYDELLAALAKARNDQETAKDTAKKRLDEFTSSDDVYTYQIQKAKEASEQIAELENTIRDMAINEYVSTGSNSPHPKIKVKIFKTFQITDPDAVRKWTFENLPAALMVDTRKIEKYAHEFGNVEGTQTGEEPRAQIATKL